MRNLLIFMLALAALTANFHVSGSESPQRIRAGALRQLQNVDRQLKPKLYNSLIDEAQKQDKLQKQLNQLSRNPPRQSSGNTSTQYQARLENCRQSLEDSKARCDGLTGTINGLGNTVSGILSSLTQQDNSDTAQLTARVDSLCSYTPTENANPGYKMVEMIKCAKQIEQCINNIDNSLPGIRQRVGIYTKNRQGFAGIAKRYSVNSKRADDRSNYSSACSAIQSHVSSVCSAYDGAISSGNGMIAQLVQSRGRLSEKLASLRLAMQTPAPAAVPNAGRQ